MGKLRTREGRDLLKPWSWWVVDLENHPGTGQDWTLFISLPNRLFITLSQF